MDPIIGGSLISAGAGALSSLVGGLFGEHYSNKQFEFNKELAYLTQHDIPQQNFLETPGNQREGLNRAGFNPALAGMNQMQASGGSASVGMQSAPNSNFDPSSMIQALSNAKLADAQARNLDADTQGKQNENVITGDEQVQEWRKQMYQFEANLKAHSAGLTESQKESANILLKQLQKADAQGINAYVNTFKEIQSRINLNNQKTLTEKHITEIQKAAAEIAKKYGILPNDDGFKSFMHLVLSGNAGKIIEAIAKAFKDALSSGISSIGGMLGL